MKLARILGIIGSGLYGGFVGYLFGKGISQMVRNITINSYSIVARNLSIANYTTYIDYVLDKMNYQTLDSIITYSFVTLFACVFSYLFYSALKKDEKYKREYEILSTLYRYY